MKEDIKYLSISELNRIIKMKFDSSAFFNRVFIKGGNIWEIITEIIELTEPINL